MNRRDFIRKSAAAAATGISMPYIIPSGVLAAEGKPGANDKVRVGFIGLGGRAKHLATQERLADFATIVALADCFLPRCHEAAKLLPDGDKLNKYQDYRQMLEKEKLDAVYVCTTTHARVLICIHAMQAGLDVYAEKPVCLSISEGRTLVNATRKYKRILQVGTQQRSIPINAWASKRIREGCIGKVNTVIACNFTGPKRWTPQPAQPMPDGLDWDKWCNQTELRPYHKDLQFRWSTWWDYDGGGDSWGVTGWGTHSLDQVQCALGTDDTGPVEIWPDEPGPDGKVSMRYANGAVLKLHGARRKYEDLGAIFIGDKGKFEIMRGHCAADPELLKGAPLDTPAPGPGENYEHFQNFFDCLRTRKLPNADVEIAQRATTVCYLVNICRELGRKLQWDPKAEKFVNDPEADKLLSRPRRKGYELPEGLA